MCKQWHPRNWIVNLDAEANGRFTKCSAVSLDDAGAELDSPQSGDAPALAAPGSRGQGESGKAPHSVRACTSVDVADKVISAVELVRKLGVRYNIMWLHKHKLRQVMK